jgi:Spy/CpxP family protein refolding chaperone
MFRSTIALAALAVAFAAAPAVVSAQAARPADSAAAVTPKHHHGHHRLLRGITLTDSQRTQLKAIRAKYGPQFKQAHQAKDRATMQQLRGQMMGEVRGVLTPDQQKQLDANIAKMKAHRQSKSETPAATTTPAPASAS